MAYISKKPTSVHLNTGCECFLGVSREQVAPRKHAQSKVKRVTVRTAHAPNDVLSRGNTFMGFHVERRVGGMGKMGPGRVSWGGGKLRTISYVF